MADHDGITRTHMTPEERATWRAVQAPRRDLAAIIRDHAFRSSRTWPDGTRPTDKDQEGGAVSEMPDQPALNPYVTDTALIVHVDGETIIAQTHQPACGHFPTRIDGDRCTCPGCWACAGHTPGCTCDIDWEGCLHCRPSMHGGRA